MIIHYFGRTMNTNQVEDQTWAWRKRVLPAMERQLCVFWLNQCEGELIFCKTLSKEAFKKNLPTLECLECPRFRTNECPDHYGKYLLISSVTRDSLRGALAKHNCRAPASESSVKESEAKVELLWVPCVSYNMTNYIDKQRGYNNRIFNIKASIFTFKKCPK